MNTYYAALQGINDETFDDYFESVRWITRDGVVSLSIQPTYLLTSAANPNGNILMARAFHAFSWLEDRFSSDYRWDHTDSMAAQFHCHVLLAGDFKTPWKIEPFRTESNLMKVMAAKCNPGGGSVDEFLYLLPIYYCTKSAVAQLSLCNSFHVQRKWLIWKLIGI